MARVPGELAALLACAVAVGACGRHEPASACAPCSSYAPAAPVGVVMAAALDEVSGLAASRRNPGVLFVHNDRDAPELFALAESGALLASFTYTGATVTDVEDIAVGPCPAGTCVFLADTGGNLGPRADYAIVRVPEPVVSATGSAGPAMLAADRLVFTYPDGAAHDAESLLVDPGSGALYVIDKVAFGLPSTAYRLPATFGGAPVVAEKVATLGAPGPADLPATAADAHPCGAGFLLATGNAAYELRIAPGAAFEDAFRATPVAVPLVDELQREGITYAPDGSGFFTTGEGSMEPINRTSCK